MHEIHVPDHRRPGWLPGAVLGLAAGVLLASIWRFGAGDVAFAVSAVFAGLVASLLAGSTGWRAFATGLVVCTVLGAGAVLVVGRGG